MSFKDVNFGRALDAVMLEPGLEKGIKIARKAWKKRGFVYYIPCRNDFMKRGMDGTIFYFGHFVKVKIVSEKRQLHRAGWKPKKKDLEAWDWYKV